MPPLVFNAFRRSDLSKTTCENAAKEVKGSYFLFPLFSNASSET